MDLLQNPPGEGPVLGRRRVRKAKQRRCLHRGVGLACAAIGRCILIHRFKVTATDCHFVLYSDFISFIVLF